MLAVLSAIALSHEAWSVVDVFTPDLIVPEKMESTTVPQSVLEAIKLGVWDFEPKECNSDQYVSTSALPGTREKVAVLSARVRKGLPLWHPDDRRAYDDDASD